MSNGRGMRWMLFSVAVLGVVALVVLGSGSRRVLTVQTRLAPDGAIIRETRQVSIDRLRLRAAESGAQAIVDNPTHDFGTIDPLTMGEHSFRIRNEGDAVLKLQQGPTTCKCALSRLESQSIPPGDEATVTVTWNSGRDPIYAHSATIFTNDSRNSVIKLRVSGQVRVGLRCEPETLTFARMVPGKPVVTYVTIYSEVWNDFVIQRVESSIKGLQWERQEISASEISSEKLQSAQRLKITLPSDLPQGPFAGTLNFQAVPALGADVAAANYELSIRGHVLRRLSVYGSAVDHGGTLSLGRVPQGQGKQFKLLLKVRDPQKQLAVQQIDATPEFLDVRVEPRGAEATKFGLYDLHIALPKDAPVYRLPPTEKGKIRIQFDHPRIDTLELPVDLIVSRGTV